MEEKPLILVTNDDGFDAPGIDALAEKLREIGDVHTVAPDEERSASAQSGFHWTSHSLNIKERPRTTTVNKEKQVYKVNGTPADCVYLAITQVLPRLPDLVVSGINLGQNLSDDVHRSGTVAGAREGAFAGVPSIAISLAIWRDSRDEPDFSVASDCAYHLALLVLDNPIAVRTFLNVNVPAGKLNGDRPVPTVLGPRLVSAGSEDEADRSTREKDQRVTDIAAVRGGLISVTQLTTDATSYDTLEELDRLLRVQGAVTRAVEKD